MAGSKFSLPPVKRAGDDFEARGRQLLAVEADIEAGRLSEAASMLNEIAKASPKDARVYITGWLLGNKAGNPAASLYSARRAVELAPMSAMAHFCLGESERSGGNPVAASASINRALMLEPTNVQYRELAVNLAYAQSDFAAAEVHLRRAFSQNEDFHGIKTMIGNALRHQSKFDEAETWLIEALASNAEDTEALHGLAMVAYLLDDRATAQKYLARAIALRPTDAGYAYLDAVFRGEAPAKAPEYVTQRLIHSDMGLIGTHAANDSKSSVAQKVSAAILERFPDRKLNVLDLGCGAGQLGAALGRIEGFFVGVDLSMPMLEAAKVRNVYSRFHHVNLQDALDATDAHEYEVIVAADVFIYLGALDAAINNAFKVLRSGGWLFFSCERVPESDGRSDFVVQKSMHYAHSEGYVKRLLAAAGFAAPLIDAVDLRGGGDAATTGFMVSVQKPA